MNMATFNIRNTWNWKIEHFLLDAALHDKRNQNQIALRQLCAEETEAIPLCSISAYSSSIRDYLRHVKVVGAEEKIKLSTYQKTPFDGCSSPHIISIRGFPDCSLIRLLGTKFHIDPDILLSHLPYPRTFQVRAISPSPNSAIHILMISVGFYTRDTVKQQDAVDFETEKYNKLLFENGTWGPEQCHRVNLHSTQFFSVEQKVTFIVHEKGDRHWSGIVLNNSGTEHSASPWCQYAITAQFLPLKQHGKLSLQPGFLPHEQNSWQNSSQRRPDPCLSRAHHGNPMTDIERDLCLEDPILFAADLLKTSALSWKLFFSFLYHQHQLLAGDPAAKAERFRRDRAVVDGARLYFCDVIALIKRREHLDWPTCSTASDRATVDSVITTLLEDFVTLQTEASELCDACNAYIGLEMNMISILDSKKSIEQAQRIQMLTFLAYLFIPLTFTCGIFSMNVYELNGTKSPIWVYFATAAPITACFALIPLWHNVVRLVKRAKLAVNHQVHGPGPYT